MSWSSNGASCSALWTVQTTPSGSEVEVVTTPTTFSITCGGITDSVEVNIENVIPIDPPVLIGPSNGATGVSLTPTLTWEPATGADRYDVRFGTVNPPSTTPVSSNQAPNTYGPTGLVASTQYWWQVRAELADESTFALSPVWTFTTGATATAPGAFTYAAPANGATGVAFIGPVLSWNPSAGVDTYNVYFGTENPPPLVESGFGSVTRTLGSLVPGTQYYWKIEAVNTTGTTAGTGGVQSFTTLAAPTGCSVTGFC
jgi:hypothetical protein